MTEPTRTNGRWLAAALLAAPYIDLRFAAVVPLPGGHSWDADVPVADAAALVLLCTHAASAWRRRPDARAVVEAVGWLMLWAVGLAGAGHGATLPGAGSSGLHALVRKPVFLCLAWRVGAAEAVRQLASGGPPRRALRGLALSAALCAAVLVGSSLARIGAGQAFWWRAIDGLTNNHKTLAVFLAPLVPLLAVVSTPLTVAVGVALLLSWSKAAWVTALFGAGWRWLPRRLRARALAAGVALGLVGMTLLPYLARSPEQIDSLNSRISLNLRAWQMFRAHPWVGYGAGSNVRYELSTYPDYRVNGVDAHGVIAKLASEHGLLGLVAWGLATGALLGTLRRRARGGALDDALLGAFLALNLNLLTSTETFSQTHWAVLALIAGLSARRR